MDSRFLLYGSYGFVGQVIAKLAIQKGLRPILSGRDEVKLKRSVADAWSRLPGFQPG